MFDVSDRRRAFLIFKIHIMGGIVIFISGSQIRDLGVSARRHQFPVVDTFAITSGEWHSLNSH